MKSLSHPIVFLLALMLWMPQFLTAQSSYHKFSIHQEGVYHISKADAQALGAKDLSQIAIYGYAGMLPQELKESDLELTEIPALEKDNKLYFYASGPHTYSFQANENLVYQHNLFSDSSSFLIGIKENPKRIPEVFAQPGAVLEATLYQWKWIKEVETNLISSGRDWFSKGVSPGVTRGYATPLKATKNAPWIMAASIMAQSTTPSKISLIVDDQLISEFDIAPVPKSTFGVKGMEKKVQEFFIPANNKVERVKITFSASDPNAAGYFREIGIGSPHSSINLPKGVFTADLTSFSIQAQADLSVWNLDDFYAVKQLNFTNGTRTTGRKFIAFNPKESIPIAAFEKVEVLLRLNNNWPELLIIAPESLSFYAKKLSTHKLSKGIYAEAVSLNAIYNEFGYGNTDYTAIRNFIAWHYHSGKKLKNVLFIGKGTFDYRGKLGGRPNLVPTYSSRNSLDPLKSYSSDDYFGLIAYGQGNWEESETGDENMQIGIGRLPVINANEASIVVDKIISYESNPSPGKWKETVTFIADDGDNNTHLRDSERHSEYLSSNYPNITQHKIYIDSYAQENSTKGQRSPDVKKELEQTLEKGTVLLNYVGHGNTSTLAHEEIFSIPDIQNWGAQANLPLWLVATCDFGRQDSPFFRSASEELLIAKDKGAIGLLTTGRPVYSSVNYELNEAFIEELFKANHEEYTDLGEVFRKTKNRSLNGALNRSFSLIGDPSMKLAKSEHSITLSSLKAQSAPVTADSLTYFQQLSFEAEVIHKNTGNLLSNFEGTYLVELIDSPESAETLGDESNPIAYKINGKTTFRGTGAVSSGMIKGELLVPKEIAAAVSESKLNLLAVSKDSLQDASGTFKIKIEGDPTDSIHDTKGPEISLILKNENPNQAEFPSSTIALEIQLFDESGIYISNHDPVRNFTIQINDEPEIPLSDFFVNTNNSYQYGKVNFTINGLQEGKNTIIIRVWDNSGNSSQYQKEIIVKGSEQLRILKHKTYPNPTTHESHFELTHNQPGKNFILTMSIYRNNGQILFNEVQRFVKASAEIKNLTWSFLQNPNRYTVKGTYIYKLTLQSEDDNSTASVSGQIVIQ